MNHLISERELNVVLMRRKGITFAKIGEELGMCYQRAQQLYQAGLESLRIENDIRKSNKAFFRAANDFDWTPKQLKRLYRLLKKRDILHTWKYMSDEELLEVRGMGVLYLNFLIYTKENYLL